MTKAWRNICWVKKQSKYFSSKYQLHLPTEEQLEREWGESRTLRSYGTGSQRCSPVAYQYYTT